MTFLLWQISLFLLLAALFGMVIGWFLHRHFHKVDQDQTDKLASELDDGKKHIKKLEREARQLKKQLASGGASSTKPKQLASSKASSSQQRSTKRSPPKKTKKSLTPDDLKEIRGIGESIENVLHEAGVTTFAQIAKLNKSQKGAIAKGLKKFTDRIERDRWVEQAKALHKEKYGKNP